MNFLFLLSQIEPMKKSELSKQYISIVFIINCLSFQLSVGNVPVIPSGTLPDIKTVESLNKQAENCSNDSIDLSLQYAYQALELAKKINSQIEQAKAFNTLAKISKLRNDNESALKYYKKVLEFRKPLGEKKYIAQAYTNIGLVFAGMGQFDSAFDYYQKSLKLKTETNDFKGIGVLYTNLANVYFKKGLYEDALLYFQKAINIFDKINYNDGLTSCLNGCGLIFENLANYEKATDYYIRALKIAEITGNQRQTADLLNNMGNVNFILKKVDKALEYYEKALAKRKEINDLPGTASSLNNIGLIYRAGKNYNKALDCFTEALEINKKLRNIYETALNINAVGKCYIDLNQDKKALSQIELSLRLAAQIDNKFLIKMNFIDLSTIYTRQRKYDKALYYYKSATTIKDTLENIDIRKKINELQTKYETEKKEHQLFVLSKQNEIQLLQLNRSRFMNIGLAALICVFLLIAFLLFRQYRLNAEHKSLMLEQKLLRTQMNPHFIFNSLTSIQSYLFDDDKMLAGKYIADFASLMRLILENSREEFITLDKEINTLKYYLELQKLRYENKFDFSITVDPALNIEMDVIPPMLGQPFVENSIKHGIAKKDTRGKIFVRINSKDKYIVFEIEDNGIGRAKAKEMQESENSKHISLALAITDERLKNFNKRNRKKIRFEIIDLEDNGQPTGTLVRFEIPLVYSNSFKRN
jgi:tetratricopeptide (TPR) repeat protein